MSCELTFEDACGLVRDRDVRMSISDSDKRLMYVYYKVVTVGPTPDKTKPPRLSPRYNYWKSWLTLGPRCSVDEARRLYVEMVRRARGELE